MVRPKTAYKSNKAKNKYIYTLKSLFERFLIVLKLKCENNIEQK